MDDKRIDIVIHRKKNKYCQRLINELTSLRAIPFGFEIGLLVIDNSDNTANAYNKAEKQSSAKYKIFIDETAHNLNKDIVFKLIDNLQVSPDVAMIGLYGSELPMDLKLSCSEKNYGMLCYKTNDTDEYVIKKGNNPVFIQNVFCIDSKIIATSQNIVWDESVGDELFAVAACCDLRRKGYKIAVPTQNEIWVMFEKKGLYLQTFDKLHKSDDYKIFMEKYMDIIQPLVSIGIPTYNQPKYFKEALESAINQSYKNIEIVIGDDSTNNDTENLIQQYLGKYNNIRYTHHKAPLGGKGANNLSFVLDNCKGEYINILFHDDKLYPNKIKKMMKYYLKDMNDEIKLVSSDRDIIDENSNYIGSISHWIPDEDTILAGERVGRNILRYHCNFIGELSTVLFRMRDIQLYGTSQKQIAFFFDYHDTSMGDVSTWLNLCKNNGKVVYIAEQLSAFRQHSEQNTCDVNILTTSMLDWLEMLLIAWNHNVYIHSETEFNMICSYYLNKWKQYIKLGINAGDNELLLCKMKLLSCFVELSEKKEYDAIVKGLNNYREANITLC